MARDHAVVEVAGAQRSQVIDALFDAHVLAPSVAASVTIRVRAAAAFGYEVRWPDGRVEGPPPDEHEQLAAALAAFEAGELARAAEQARAAGVRLQEAVRAAVHARAAEAARAEAARAEAARVEAARVEAARVEAARAEAARATSTTTARAPSAATAPLRSRGWLRRLFARLLAWLRALVSGTPPATPPLPPPATAPLPALPAAPSPPAPDDSLELEAALAGAKARLAALSDERDERRRALEGYQAERERRGRARLVELTTAVAPSWNELDLGAPDLPPEVVLVLRPAARDREPLDATLFADASAAAAPPTEDRPSFALAPPLSRAALLRRLELIVAERPVAVARRIVAALCLCRNRILDLDRRARAAHEERSGELGARCLDEVDVIRREEAGAQLPIARHGEKIVQAAAARLEALLAEVRAAWQQRIDSCAGLEQLRAEVAAIEDGAAHRLALVCDELRETMTIQFVRLVLELSRPLRDELGRKRIEVARGRSPTLEQSFDDLRVVLPASLDKTFGALATPDIGELLDGERSLFDPLFRTLAREKRSCVTRLCARLDDIERTTTRDLYAAAVFVSPLIAATFKGLVSELVAAHQRWIDTLVAEEELAWQRLCVRHAPALELVAPLEAAETGLAARLERG